MSRVVIFRRVVTGGILVGQRFLTCIRLAAFFVIHVALKIFGVCREVEEAGHIRIRHRKPVGKRITLGFGRKLPHGFVSGLAVLRHTE